jgi:hypothetical protein
MRLYRDPEFSRYYRVTADHIYTWKDAEFIMKSLASNYIPEHQWTSVGAKLSCPLEAVLLGVDVFNT